ncbi:CLUMA_CG020156, isoform A [Clunio marinus]|uniref:CLUMA_CG020156, isoform A n=1 Tax=Clunio marinus TaxID=568069 RepID=A0A1J1J431_9DIPT|nr:CLUMA_CG020156, isoform A [Clunio marinus]
MTAMDLQPIRKQLHLNPYEYHKYLINEYVLKKPGDSNLIRERDRSKWKSDKDVILENLKFIWNENDIPESWEERIAKKYYDKLFREYCICDLSKYKENRIANRFRIEKEVITGKGQFICGEKSCQRSEALRTWEVNFSYTEKHEKKNALVKIRLCEECSEKLNHRSKKREIKRLSKRKSKQFESLEKPAEKSNIGEYTHDSIKAVEVSSCQEKSGRHENIIEENLWTKSSQTDHRSRDEEFDEYLADLLL